MNLKRFISAMVLSGMLVACQETTITQREYADHRDQCRLMAEQRMGGARLDPNANNSGDARKALLIAFKDCMQSRGWAVTGPEKGDGKQQNDTPPLAAAVAVAPLTPPPNAPQNIEARRAEECRYARANIHHSSNARALARACDLECKNKQRLAPDMPTPGACADSR